MNSVELVQKIHQSLREYLAENPLYASKIKQGYDLEQCLTDQDVLKEMYHSFIPLEKKVLKLLLLEAGYSPFSWSQIERWNYRPLIGSELKLGLIYLRRKGIVFTLRKTWGEHIYIIPRESFATWISFMMEDCSLSDAEALEIVNIEPLEDSRRGLVYDLYRLLVFTAKNGLKLTQKGTIHKQLLLKLYAKMELKSDDLLHMPMQYADRNVYTPSFAIIYDAALRLGLLEQQVNAIVVNKENVNRWLNQTHAQMQAILYQLWTETHKPSAIWVQHFTVMMELIPSDDWTPIDKIIKYVCNMGVKVDHQTDQQWEEVIDGEWLKPLAGMGWIERGRTNDGRLAIRWTASHQDEEAFYIQPDFEIIVPPAVPYRTQWELECIAEHVNSDRTSHYLLSKESIHHAANHGRTSEGMIQFLRDHSKYELPENVQLMVEQWRNQYGQVSLSEAILLSCKDEKTAEEIANHPACRSFLGAKLGNKDFMIMREHMAELMSALQKYGFDPIKKTNEANQESTAYPELEPIIDTSLSKNMTSFQSGKYQGLVYSKQAVHYYEWESKIPNLDEVYPQLDLIPAIWINECRNYHKSTKKELLDKAIQWQSYVRLHKGGEWVQFVPVRLADSVDHQWRVEGFISDEEVHIFPDEWEGMQLILPGINDV